MALLESRLRVRQAVLVAASALVLGACETAPDEAPYEGNASMGMLIARENCASCHETFSSRGSPDERAPAFREIVNRPDMTPGRLSGWLRDAHNYPLDMGFSLQPHQVDSLVAYMMSERDPGE